MVPNCCRASRITSLVESELLTGSVLVCLRRLKNKNKEKLQGQSRGKVFHSNVEANSQKQKCWSLSRKLSEGWFWAPPFLSPPLSDCGGQNVNSVDDIWTENITAGSLLPPEDGEPLLLEFCWAEKKAQTPGVVKSRSRKEHGNWSPVLFSGKVLSAVRQPATENNPTSEVCLRRKNHAERQISDTSCRLEDKFTLIWLLQSF